MIFDSEGYLDRNNMFANSTELTKLYFSQNTISSLDVERFSGLYFHLSSNKLVLIQ